MSASPSVGNPQPETAQKKSYWTTGKIIGLVLVVTLIVSGSTFAAVNYLKPSPAAPICSNGATNPPACNACPSGQSLASGSCQNNCTNGATNPTACNICPAGQILVGGNCVRNCTNGTSNPPACDNTLTFSVDYSPHSPNVGQEVVFLVLNRGGGVSPFYFTWSFGDGSTGTSSTALGLPGSTTHTYLSAGTFPVSVTAKDSGSPQQTFDPNQVVITVTNPMCSNGASNYPACNMCANGASNPPSCNMWPTTTSITCSATTLVNHNLNSTSCEIRVSSQAPTLPTGSVGVGASGSLPLHANNVPCTLTVFVGYSYCTITEVSTSAPAGTLTLNASYAGDSTNVKSTGSVSLTVVDPPRSVTVSGTAGVFGVGVAYRIGFVDKATDVGYTATVYGAGAGTSGTYTISLPNLTTYAVTVYYSATINGSTACGTLPLQSISDTLTSNYKC